MKIQYAIYDGYFGNTISSYQGGDLTLGSLEEAGWDLLAAGAFDGTDGLLTDTAQLASASDFDGYVAALTGKTTQISSEALHLTVSGVYGRFVVLGGHGADVVSANSPDAVPSTGSGLIWGRDGDDNLTGGAGNDVLAPGAGADTADGGGGTDTVSYFDAAVGVHVDLTKQGGAQDTGVGLQVLSNFEAVVGSDHDDVLTGSWWGTVDGGAGDDILAGGYGATLIGGAGSDTASFASATGFVGVSLQQQDVVQGAGSAGMIYLSGIENLVGGDFDDMLIGASNANKLSGGAGDDMLMAGDGGADTLDGGPGQSETNTVSYEGAATGVTVSLGLDGQIQDTGIGQQVLSNLQVLIGSSHNDVLSGAADTVWITGEDGADTINGASGAAQLSGGSQVDIVTYAGAATGVTVNLALLYLQQDTGVGQQTLDGFENLAGSSHDDRLTGDGGFNLILGAAGDDTVVASWGADTLQGGAGIDTVDFSNAWTDVTVDLNLTAAYETGIGAQVIKAFENVTGSYYNDHLIGTAAANVLDGGGSWDTLAGGGGADTLIGGDGYDTVSYEAATAGVHVSLLIQDRAQNTGDGKQVLTGIEAVRGSNFADDLTGLGVYSTVDGGKGDDTLRSGGGTGDTLQGGDGDDLLVFSSVYDRAYGGDGTDTLAFDTSFSGVSVDLATGRLGYTGEVYEVENVVGTAGADRLAGDGDANHLVGGKGADTIYGGGGGDTLEGGAGVNTVSYAGSHGVGVSLALQGAAQDTGSGLQVLSGFRNLEGSMMNDALVGDRFANRIDASYGDDTVYVSAGDDTLIGGGGSDTVSFANAAKGVTIDLDVTGPQLTPGGALTLSGFETLVGSAKADNLTGGYNPNLIVSGGGADHVWGGDGNDVLVSGGDGDILSGGAGIDTFTYVALQKAAVGEIVDLDPNDLIDLSGAAQSLGLQQFTEVSRFNGAAGEVKVQFDAAANRTTFQFDTDGDKKGDHALVVDGDHRDFTAFIGVDVSGMVV